MILKSSVYIFQALLIFGMAILISCKEEQKVIDEKLQKGTYRGVLELMDNKELPFVFSVLNENKLEVYNAEEVIEINDIKHDKDSVIIRMPAFEGYIVAKITDNGLEGNFIKESLDRIVPFRASKNNPSRFPDGPEAKYNIEGSWQTVFSKGVEGDEYIAKGIFKQQGSLITGTFRTTTGDYRFLEGVLNEDVLKLSTFDGAHAFLFEAKVTDSSMIGTFYSGNHWKEPFEAVKNNNYELPGADELTFLKEGYDALKFEFPDLNGNMVSSEDVRFKNKVLIVQIMGSWCPNCLDETKYYTEYYKAQKPDDVEIIALAFEYAKTKDKALKSLEKLREDASIPYPILLAQHGSSSKEEAQKKLPMLNHVLSYPTTIFIDKKGKVRKIHTGFNGPATGEKFVEFKEEFTTFVAKLVAE